MFPYVKKYQRSYYFGVKSIWKGTHFYPIKLSEASVSQVLIRLFFFLSKVNTTATANMKLTGQNKNSKILVYQ